MSEQEIARGFTITLDALTRDGESDAVNPTDVRVSIVDPLGATIVALAVPAQVGDGHFQYAYAVDRNAMLGQWIARWSATVDGTPIVTDDLFAVTSTEAQGYGITAQPWATVEDAPPALQAYGIDPFKVNDAFQAASDILFELTARRYPGQVQDYIRPQAQWQKIEGPPKWWPSAMYWGFGTAYGFCSCHRGRETGCVRVPEVKLPGHPVDPSSIVVKIDGFEFEDFRLDDGRFLVRLDRNGWPCCQQLLEPDTEPNTFSISYRYGKGPDIGGKRSAVLLGTVLFAEWFPEEAAQCGKLPSRATRVTRQGTSVDLGDPIKMVEAGLTGIRTVDLWVASKSLGVKRRRASVLIPGHHRGVRRPNT